MGCYQFKNYFQRVKEEVKLIITLLNMLCKANLYKICNKVRYILSPSVMRLLLALSFQVHTNRKHIQIHLKPTF